MSVCLNPCCNGRWSRTIVVFSLIGGLAVVLILVVMEDGLGLDGLKFGICFLMVLILVVMEDGLGLDGLKFGICFLMVLILVVMEDGLGRLSA